MDIYIYSSNDMINGNTVSIFSCDNVKNVLDRICTDNDVKMGIFQIIEDGKNVDDDMQMSGLNMVGNILNVEINVGFMSACTLNDMNIDVTVDNFVKYVTSGSVIPEHLRIINLFMNIPHILNAIDDCDRSPLRQAVEYCETETVKLLCGVKGIDVNIRDHRRRTPLMVASNNVNVEMVKVLCGVDGIDINAVDDCGMTALMMGIFHDRDNISDSGSESNDVDEDVIAEVVKTICDVKGVDVDIRDDYGNTARSFSIYYKVDAILEHYV